jgi:hypothetical protein
MNDNPYRSLSRVVIFRTDLHLVAAGGSAEYATDHGVEFVGRAELARSGCAGCESSSR